MRRRHKTGDDTAPKEREFEMRKVTKTVRTSEPRAEGRCLCGDVHLEIDVPAFWAWHDHSKASRRAHGAAYSTYVGCWRSRVRVLKGSAKISRFHDKETGAVRSFCVRCGTPLFYDRARSPQMTNIPRALFAGRTGREPRYHLGLGEAAEWEYRGETLVPLKGYPGVMWERPGRKNRRETPDDF
jgi:hypothetical protein